MPTFATHTEPLADAAVPAEPAAGDAATAARRRGASIESIGLMGLGAFGRLIASRLAPHFRVVAHDPAATGEAAGGAVRLATVAEVAAADLVILAVPVREMVAAIASLCPHLRPGTIVVDVGSVKVKPARVMLAGLPPDVDIVGTHPLFGPQSAKGGIRGRKIAVCPVRGRRHHHIAAFLRRVLGLQVFLTSPEEHDREAALVQGVTHLIAKVLVGMEPLPRRLTTASFDHLMQATEMVRYDAASVFEAIERENPFAAAVRERFFALAAETRAALDGRHA